MMKIKFYLALMVGCAGALVIGFTVGEYWAGVAGAVLGFAVTRMITLAVDRWRGDGRPGFKKFAWIARVQLEMALAFAALVGLAAGIYFANYWAAAIGALFGVALARVLWLAVSDEKKTKSRGC